MTVLVPTEVIPIWYIEKWKKENACEESPLYYFLDKLVEDYRIEEKEKDNT